jgi:hypothetical protein
VQATWPAHAAAVWPALWYACSCCRCPRGNSHGAAAGAILLAWVLAHAWGCWRPAHATRPRAARGGACQGGAAGGGGPIGASRMVAVEVRAAVCAAALWQHCQRLMQRGLQPFVWMTGGWGHNPGCQQCAAADSGVPPHICTPFVRPMLSGLTMEASWCGSARHRPLHSHIGNSHHLPLPVRCRCVQVVTTHSSCCLRVLHTPSLGCNGSRAHLVPPGP